MPSHHHPIYTTAERLLEQGMSPRQMDRLRSSFHRLGLPLPLDFAAALMGEGFILSAQE